MDTATRDVESHKFYSYQLSHPPFSVYGSFYGPRTQSVGQSHLCVDLDILLWFLLFLVYWGSFFFFFFSGSGNGVARSQDRMEARQDHGRLARLVRAGEINTFIWPPRLIGRLVRSDGSTHSGPNPQKGYQFFESRQRAFVGVVSSLSLVACVRRVIRLKSNMTYFRYVLDMLKKRSRKSEREKKKEKAGFSPPSGRSHLAG